MPVAFAHRAYQQGLQAGPGRLRMDEGFARLFEGLVVGAVGDGAGRRATVGFGPVGVGGQQDAIGQRLAGFGLRIGRRAGAQQQGCQQTAAGHAQGVGTNHGVLVGIAGLQRSRAGKAWIHGFTQSDSRKLSSALRSS